MDKYVEFIKDVELKGISLVNLQCNRENSFENAKDLAVDMETKTINQSQEETSIFVVARFDIKCYDKNNNDKMFFKIIVDFELEYSVNQLDNLSEDIINKFCINNVPINVWPYGREIISSITTRMGYPALTIGTYKLIR